MILVDTSVWIDHLHKTDPGLVTLLEADEVGCHESVIQELALGSIRQRTVVLDLLDNLYRFPVLGHAEVVALVDRRRLHGRGLSAVDAHLLGSVSISGGAQLWTRDKRLRSACRDAGVSYVDESG
ncbi:type II toxin-antitoxin system VapC family toxin [Mycobacterium celatum]|uniref:Ribonuclease VapC n=1 Tax=Mycobacterium celatum TaxID=28045 RepID=A0A1X1RHJ0_MYCCE|nr:type II toxin-antitoxin system VapC family toxin [Mycobacterium celatum]ORV06376.1 ribonuclease [Mycobacterium celatum]PIB78799.1 PIN domain-containing protein [Mycobacterium celatum]